MTLSLTTTQKFFAILAVLALVAGTAFALTARMARADEEATPESAYDLCTNGIDDNGNGLVDAEDPACFSYYHDILTVVNHVVGATTSPADFSFTINGVGSTAGLGSFTFEVDGENNYENTPVGQYAITETPVPGYTITYDNCGSGSLGDNALTISVNDVEETCTITNTKIASSTDTGSGSDLCTNIDGTQATVPEGMTASGGVCTATGGSGSDASTTPSTSSDGSSNGSSGGGVSNGSGGHSHKKSNGEVLGASTDTATCSPLITSYMRLGWNNNPSEVMRLQTFLNGELGLVLPLTGFFDKATANAVGAFQAKYWDEVLKPWVGTPNAPIITSPDDATGFLYKTTKWKINNLSCAGSEAAPIVP